MTRRQSRSIARVGEGVRRAVADGLEAIRSLVDVRPDRPDRGAVADRGAEDRPELTPDGGTTARPASPSRTVPIPVDPENGPTSRGEILEYGCTPADYVRAVLAEHGGRVKQRRFVDDYGWSPSTISRLLSDVEERGAIVRYRIGREKAVRLPDGTGESDGADGDGSEDRDDAPVRGTDDWSASTEIGENDVR